MREFDLWLSILILNPFGKAQCPELHSLQKLHVKFLAYLMIIQLPKQALPPIDARIASLQHCDLSQYLIE